MPYIGVRGAKHAVTAQLLQARGAELVGAGCHCVTKSLFFSENARILASGFALNPAAERFVLRLWCSFLLRWRSLEWNFVLCQEFFRCRRSPRPNGWKMSPGTLITQWKIIELFRGRNLQGPLNGAVCGAYFHGNRENSMKFNRL